MQPLYITTINDLPMVDTAYETSVFDMKTAINSPTQTGGTFVYDFIELAKDIAAFANSIGGVILVEAQEAKRGNGRLKGYVPVSDTEAKQIRNAYNTAARDHCRPSPMIDIHILPKDSGYIIAINVLPFFSQPIGVKTKTEKGVSQKAIDTWFFPVRIGVVTQFLNPEELHMLMLTSVRRAAYLINSIPIISREQIYLKFEQYSGGSVEGQTREAKLIEFNIYENTIIFQVPDVYTDKAPMRKCLVPLDSVLHVWNDGHRWNVAISGTLFGCSWEPFILRRA